jgi:hypothetical protein
MHDNFDFGCRYQTTVLTSIQQKSWPNQNNVYDAVWPPLEAQVAVSPAATVPLGVELGEYF